MKPKIFGSSLTLFGFAVSAFLTLTVVSTFAQQTNFPERITIKEQIAVANTKERVIEAIIRQKPTDLIASMENTTEQSAEASREIPLRWDSGVYAAFAHGTLVEGDFGGFGGGIELGASYATPNYAVELKTRGTLVTLFFLGITRLISVSIGGRVYPNTYIAPYIGAGFSFNYGIVDDIFSDERRLKKAGVYSVFGIEVPFFKFRPRLECRLDWMPDVEAGSLGLSVPIEF